MALACERLGDFESARRHLEKAIELDPEDTAARLTLARVYAERDEYERADALLGELLDTEAHDDAHVDLVYSMMEQGRIEDAVRLARAETQARPDSAGAWLALSVALHDARDPAGAGEALERLQALDPSGRWTWWETEQGELSPPDHSIATGSPTRSRPASTT